MRNPERLVTKHFLLTTVWGPAYGSEDGYLRLYLGQLRKRLEPEPSRPRYLLTEPGMGLSVLARRVASARGPAVCPRMRHT